MNFIANLPSGLLLFYLTGQLNEAVRWGLLSEASAQCKAWAVPSRLHLHRIRLHLPISRAPLGLRMHQWDAWDAEAAASGWRQGAVSPTQHTIHVAIHNPIHGEVMVWVSKKYLKLTSSVLAHLLHKSHCHLDDSSNRRTKQLYY